MVTVFWLLAKLCQGRTNGQTALTSPSPFSVDHLTPSAPTPTLRRGQRGWLSDSTQGKLCRNFSFTEDLADLTWGITPRLKFFRIFTGRSEELRSYVTDVKSPPRCFCRFLFDPRSPDKAVITRSIPPRVPVMKIQKPISYDRRWKRLLNVELSLSPTGRPSEGAEIANSAAVWGFFRLGMKSDLINLEKAHGGHLRRSSPGLLRALYSPL
jgi:hypothetical protein